MVIPKGEYTRKLVYCILPSEGVFFKLRTYKMLSKFELKELSLRLLRLHKALMSYEQKEYEEMFGKVSSPHQFLDLLMNHPHFSWLRTLSQLIVGIDELVDSKENVLESQVDDLVKYTQSLVTGNKEDTDFMKKYITSVQKDPHVALAHGKVIQMLKGK
jgi:hypothetical protein